MSMFPTEKDLNLFLETSKDQLDFFLTGMSLSGTHSESCKNEELGEFINELEDMVEDIEDYIGEDEADEEDGQDIKEFLLDSWKEFASTK